MLADDPLGAMREAFRTPLPESYCRAFEAIERDPNNELVVAEKRGNVVGVLQITFIPYLTYQGGWRALIEGVRVSSKERSSGIGRQLFEWAIERARQQREAAQPKNTDGLTIAQRKEIAEIEARRAPLQAQQNPHSEETQRDQKEQQ